MENKDMHALWFALLVVIALATYGLYSDTRRNLEEAEQQIKNLASESGQTIESQQNTIEERDRALEQSKADEQVLQQALDELQVSSGASSGTTVVNNVIGNFAPAVVRLVCLRESDSQTLQQGSGLLFKGNAILGVGPYYVQTNLHVVETDDGSPSQCVVAVHPNLANPENYIVYKSEGYRLYKKGLDLAYIEPTVIADNRRAGTLDQLVSYALDDSVTTVCSSVTVGNHVSVLGYPSIGGDSLTVTDGIVSGFELRNKTRYIKTSAKIDQGNSGGVAIEDSGCVIGIPTFVQAQIESLGRILDLQSVFSG